MKNRMQKNEGILKRKLLLTAGISLTTVGLLLLLVHPFIIESITNMMFSLQPSGFVYNVWRKNPMPLKLEFYLFNWTNPKDFYNASVKPKFEELGPYVYSETREKANIKWNDHNNTVTYGLRRFWHFDRESSVHDLSTKVVSINPIVATAAYMVRNWSFFLRKGFDMSMRTLQQNIYKQSTVGQVLFEGYEDATINIYKKLFIGPSMELPPNMDKFGWFYTRNGSDFYDGVFNIMRSGENFGNTEEWNYMKTMPYYRGECNRVHGSAGEFYPRNLQRDKIGFFSPDVCRYIPLDYSEDEMVGNVPGYKYVVRESFLDNGTNVPENQCFNGGELYPSGVVNVSACRYGSPAFVSQPHFYGADPYYTSNVEGLNPIKEKHEMFMTMEPSTGIPLKVAARLQLSLLIVPIESISYFEDVKKHFFPVMWFQQKAEIPPNLLFLLKLYLNSSLIAVCISVALLLCGFSILFWIMHKPIVERFRYKKVNQKSGSVKSQDSQMGLMHKIDRNNSVLNNQ